MAARSSSELQPSAEGGVCAPAGSSAHDKACARAGNTAGSGQAVEDHRWPRASQPAGALQCFWAAGLGAGLQARCSHPCCQPLAHKVVCLACCRGGLHSPTSGCCQAAGLPKRPAWLRTVGAPAQTRFCELYDSLWARLNVASATGAMLQCPGGATAGVPSAALVSLQGDVLSMTADLQVRPVVAAAPGALTCCAVVRSSRGARTPAQLAAARWCCG